MNRRRRHGLVVTAGFVAIVWSLFFQAAAQAPQRVPTPNDTLVSPEILVSVHDTGHAAAHAHLCAARLRLKKAPLSDEDPAILELTGAKLGIAYILHG